MSRPRASNSPVEQLGAVVADSKTRLGLLETLAHTHNGGGGGSPGGVTGSVQYNDAGSFGGTANFTTDGSSITAVVDVTASGTVSALDVTATGTVSALDVTASATVSAFDVTATGTVSALDVTATGTISGTHSGSGAALTSLNASELTTGTVPAARLSGAYTGITGLGTITTATVIDNSLTVDGTTLYVDSTNDRVGIGTTSPQVELHLKKGLGAGATFDIHHDIVVDSDGNGGMAIYTPNTSNGYFRFGDNDSSYSGGFQYDHPTDLLRIRAGGTDRVFIDSSGNVGIDNASPSYKLDVSGTLHITGQTTADGDVYFQNNALVASNAGTTNIDHIWHDDGANAWNFCSDTTYKAVGNSTVKAGAGSFSGTVTAGTFSGSGASLTSLNASNLSSGTVSNDRISGAYSGITTLTVTSGIILPDGSSGTPSVRWGSDTNTGFYRPGADRIGVTCGSSIHEFRTDGIHLGSGDWFRSYSDTGWYNGTHGGGMYMTEATWVRTYNGKGILWTGQGAAGVLPATTTTSGYRYVLQNTTFTSLHQYTSRRDLKENISSLDAFIDTGSVIDALRPVTFTSKYTPPENEPDTPEPPEAEAWRLADVQIGFIADEVADACPQLASFDTVDGELVPGAWKWEATIAVLVSEVQSLRSRLAALEPEV